MEQRTWTLLKETCNLFIFLRSKGTFWRRVTTYKGGCDLGPRWPDSQCVPPTLCCAP